MAEKFEEIAVVVDQSSLGNGIYDLTLKTDKIAKAAKAGQFVSVYSNDKSKLLPRPISLCGINRDEDTIRLVYRVTGEGTGTEEFSKLVMGDKVRLLGPLGNGFTVQAASFVATEDGSVGTKGNVIDAIKENALEADVIYACGPMPMLRALKAYSTEHDMDCFVSMEERMACGIGACLACVCKTKDKDAHSNVNNKRICKEGPVFDAKEVEL